MDSHACDACGGSGMSTAIGVWCPVACPVCLGAGSFPDRMPARDALADAETLRRAHDSEAGNSESCWCVGPSGERHLPCCDLLDAMAWASISRIQRSVHGPESDMWHGAIEESARAAFRAVPGLRGETGTSRRR